MKIFLETDHASEMKELKRWGVVFGVFMTSKATDAQIKEMCVEAEMVFVECDITRSQDIIRISPNTIPSFKFSLEALRHAQRIKAEDRKANLICRSANQALLCGNAEIAFVSLTIGELQDAGFNGMEIVENTRPIFDNYGFETQIVSFQIRNAAILTDVARIGSDCSIVPAKIIKEI